MYIFYARPFEELEEEEEEEDGDDDGEYRVFAISCMSLEQCILPPLRVLLCIETLIVHAMCLKGLIAEPLLLLRFYGRVGAIPT